MAQYVQNMPARYRAQFSTWRNALAPNTYGNTGTWISGINSGQLLSVNSGYQRATSQLLQYDPNQLSAMNADELSRVQSQYASVELSDGANTTAMATIGAIRGDAQDIQTQIANLEQDSFSADPDLNTEVSVLNKINAASVLTLRTVQDSNKLLASLQRAHSRSGGEFSFLANADISRRANLSGNIAQVTSTLTDSLQNFRMP